MQVKYDLSIGLFENKELTAFNLGFPLARNSYSTTCGDSCNCQVIDNFIPHVHCTHTETIHHVYQMRSKSSVQIVNNIPFFLNYLAVNYDELQKVEENEEPDALGIRFNKSPPYGSKPAHMKPSDIELILERFPNVEHLLVDLPSLDAHDDNSLSCHKKFFFNVPEGTITEICNFSGLPNSNWVMKLHLDIFPIFGSDAHPSRPLLVDYD